MHPRHRLLVVQRRLTHYRVPFFEALRHALDRQGVELTLVVGTPTSSERLKNDEGALDWAGVAPCRYLGDGRLCWQDLGPWLGQADAVIVTQENRLLNNLPLLLGRHRRHGVGLWGHGGNLQAPDTRRARALQAVKEALSRRADWWFAYTETSARLVRGFDFPAGRITTLNNAIDTRALGEQVRRARATPRADLRRELGLTDAPVGLFVGSLYADKRLDLLVAGARRVRERCPGFQVAVLGAGPLADALKAQVADHPWFRVLGARHGEEKARWLASADLLLNPGLVGLGILDAFAAELPMVTTDCGVHSPEIAYLAHGRNGLMTAPRPQAFADGVLEVLRSDALAGVLRAGCAASAREYSLEAMVGRFCDGVQRWREAGPIARPRARSEAEACR
jgi:glycosyltransferase involved in cell wall biosynthesis